MCPSFVVMIFVGGRVFVCFYMSDKTKEESDGVAPASLFLIDSLSTGCSPSVKVLKKFLNL